MAGPSSTRRRFRQFSLRGLLVLLALVAIAFGIWSNASAQREWRALQSFDKGLRVSLTRRNSLGSLEYVQGFQSQAKLARVGDPPPPWVLWRADSVQSLFIQSEEPHMAATALDPLVDIPTIERLELHVDEMDPQSLQSLQRLKQLESLEWSGNFDEACLLALPRLPSLKRLELAPKDSSSLGTGLQALERLPKLSHLDVTLDHEAECSLRHARLSPTPLALDIELDPVMSDHDGSIDFSDMSAWSSVYYLKLRWLNVKGPIDFASMPNLQTIDFNWIQLSDTDVEELAKLPKLERLTLSGTEITDRQLAQILRIPTLVGVDIHERDVTSAAFAGLSDCQRLETLRVPDQVVDGTFLEVLRAAPAVKSCEVVRLDAPPMVVDSLQAEINKALQRK